MNGDFGKDRMEIALLYIQEAVTDGSVYSAAAAIAEILNATAECAVNLVAAREIAAASGFYVLYVQAEAASKVEVARLTIHQTGIFWNSSESDT